MSDKNEILDQLDANPPKIIGGYKRAGWAVKILENISNESVEKEDAGKITAKAVLQAADQTYYPSFLTLDLENEGKILGAYLISENEEVYQLIPFEIARNYIKKADEDLTPFRYRTLDKIEGDLYQQNWPDFS